MILYTLQSIETMSLLYKYKVLFLSPTTEEQQKYMDRYNSVKNNEFSSAPIFWYKSKLLAGYNFVTGNKGLVLVKAEIPDSVLLTPEYITPYIDIYWIMNRETSDIQTNTEM